MPIKILFVCMGNICRSPAAQTIMQDIINKNNLSDKFIIDSCGIIDYHAGNPADPRMQEQALKKNYQINHLARQIDPEKDFEEFDYILVMDDENLDDIYDLDNKKNYRDKISKLTDYAGSTDFDIVPDPYYKDEDGFETVIKILEDSCNGFLKYLKENERFN